MKIRLLSGMDVEIAEYWWIVKRMTPEQQRRAWLWCWLRFTSGEAVEAATRLLIGLVQNGQVHSPHDQYIHLWTDMVLPSDHTTGVVPVATDEYPYERRHLMLTDDDSLWTVVHEIAHLMDLPRVLRPRNGRGRPIDHGRTFIAHMLALGDAAEGLLPEVLKLARSSDVQLVDELALAHRLLEDERCECPPREVSGTWPCPASS